MKSFLLPLLLMVFVGCNNGSLVRSVEEPERSKSVDVASSDDTTSSTPDATDPTPASTSSASTPPSPATAGSTEVEPVQVISFNDLNLGMPEDARFRMVMLEFNDGRAKELLEKTVNLGGNMLPGDQLRGLTSFVLLKNKECKFGPGGQADHLAQVFMKEGTTVDYTDKVIYVEGKLTLKPRPTDKPMTWSIYDIEATNVSTRAPSRQR